MSDTKPFDANHARDGAPYGCRNGNRATVLRWDAQNSAFPLIGTVIFSDDREQPESWTAHGMRAVGNGEGGSDLVMLPLGYIDGKPVFVGDEYEFDGRRYRAVPDGEGGFEGCRWPEPAKQYPVTRMTREQLTDVARNTPGSFGESYEAIANAALRHAIDNGQVVTTEKGQEAVRLAIDIFKPDAPKRAARDLAIAEAVRREAVRIACSYNHSTLIYNAIDRADLTAIIAKVLP